MTDRLKQLFGPKCSAININGESGDFINIPSRELKFCEAVDQSFKVPLRLNSENLGCPGARRSVGFTNNDKQLAKEISGNSHIPLNFINIALQNIPAMNGIRQINMGLTECMENDLQPDLFIMYIQPFRITELLHKLAKISEKPSIPPYFFLSVCGNVFTNCYLNKVACVSFGCPDSRNYGGIGENDIVLGLPYKIASRLVKYYKD